MTLLFIAFCAWINRWAGGGPPGHIWGGPCLIPGVALGAVSALCFGWVWGVIAGLGFIAWRLEGWGGYCTMGRSSVPNRKEIAWIDRLVRPSLGYGWEGDAAGFALRQVFALPFFFGAALYTDDWLLLAWLLPFAALITGAYLIAFRFWYPQHLSLQATALAELLTGALWGGILLGVAHG